MIIKFKQDLAKCEDNEKLEFQSISIDLNNMQHILHAKADLGVHYIDIVYHNETSIRLIPYQYASVSEDIEKDIDNIVAYMSDGGLVYRSSLLIRSVLSTHSSH